MRNEAEQPAIRPEDVAARSFAFARKGGYEPREVQDFLRRVGEELRVAQHHAFDLEHTLTIRTEELERARNVDEAEMTRMLGLETVKVLDAAREAAAQIRVRAEADAGQVLEAAQEQADAIRSEASQVLEVRKAEADAAVADMLRQAAASLEEAREATEAAKARAEAEGEAHLESVRERGREMVGEAQAVRERMLRDLSRRRKALKNQIDQLQAARDRLLAAYEVVRRTTDEASGELEGMLDAARDAAQQAADQRPVPQGDPDADIIAVIEAVRAERRAELGERADLLEFDDPEVADDDGAGGAEAGGAEIADEDGAASDVAASDVADGDAVEAKVAASVVEVEAEVPTADALAAPAEPQASVDVASEGGESPGDGAAEPAPPAASEPAHEVASTQAAEPAAGEPGVASGAQDDVTGETDGGGAGGAAGGTAAAPGGFYDFGSEIDVEAGGAAAAEPDAPTGGDGEPELDVDWWESDEAEAPDGDAAASPRAVGEGLDGGEEASGGSEAGGDVDSSAEKPGRSAAGKEAVSLFARLREEASAGAEPAAEETGSDDRDGEPESSGDGGEGPPDADEAADRDGAAAAADDAGGDAGPTSDPVDAAIVDDDAPAEGTPSPGSASQGAASDEPVDDDADEAPAELTGDSAADEAAGSVADDDSEDDDSEDDDSAGGEADGDTGSADDELLARRDAALGEVRTTLARRLKRTVADEQNEVLDVLRRHRGKVDLDLVFPVLEEHVERYADASLPTLAAAAAAGAEFVQSGWPATVRPAPRTRVGDVAEELGIEVVVPLRDAVSVEIERHGDDIDALDEGVREAYRRWKVDTPDAVAGRAASLAFHRSLREQVGDGVEMRWIVGDEACSAATLESDPSAVPPVRPGCACLVVPAAAPEA